MNQGRRRVIIERVSPEIDGGRFPIKRVPGEPVEVEADIFADGHDVISALLLYRSATELTWTELEMAPLPNDRWRATFDPGNREPGPTPWRLGWTISSRGNGISGKRPGPARMSPWNCRWGRHS